MFKGYKACSDPHFVKYIKDRQDEYNDGADYTVETMMEKAINKYRNLMEDGEWRQPSEQDKQILALTAALNKLQNKSTKKSTKSDSGTGKKKDTTKKEEKSTDDGKKKKKREYPDWKLKAPADGEPKTKKVQERTYHWCKYHKMWTAHKESDCQKGSGNDQSNNNNSNQSRLQLNATMATIAERDESDE